MRKVILLAGGLLVLIAANAAIVQRERQLASGTPLILALAPRDPRSLMQGDYMALAYALERELGNQEQDGRLVLAPDAQGVARLVRIDNGTPLAPGQVLVDYRLRQGRVRIGTDAWFFPEGKGATYVAARYGEFRADGRGAVLLVRLLDEQLKPLGSP